MNAAKRGKIYLTRKKGKTVILLLILSVVTALLLLCGTVWKSTDEAMEHLRSSMGGYFKIEANIDKGYANHVTDQLVDEIMQNEGIKAYNGTDIVYALAENLELEPGRFTMEGDEKAKLARVIGTTDSRYNEYFSLGSLVLEEGEPLAEGGRDKALISRELADRNQIRTGDTILLQMYQENETQEHRVGSAHEVEVAGIYSIKSTQNEKTANTAECDLVENFIFVNTGSIRDMLWESRGQRIDAYSYGVTFYVTDPRNLDRVMGEAEQELNAAEEKYVFTKNNKTYEETAAVLERLNGMMLSMILVFFFVGFLVLSLVLVLTMRDRVHEIGVLASIGYRKRSIIGQYLFENVCIAAGAFCIAFAAVWAVAGSIEPLLNGTIETAETEPKAQQIQLARAKEVTMEGENVDLQIRVTPGPSLIILGVECLLAVFSTGIYSVSVIRLKPKKILSMME